ncbi:MAG TPA: MBL fold metallo-hydrolase [Gemmatimonadaceae bacterium]|nr:MBL fold metallo-hydrolase [Gemmatimonadaceae bacterium]
MRVTVLGTAGASPYPSRVQTGVLIDAPPVRLLIDCGSGITHRLAQLDNAWKSITHVAFTHFHSDHTIDFVGLIVAWKWGQLPQRQEPLTLIGPVGTSSFAQRLVEMYNEPFAQLPFPLEVVEVVPSELRALSSELSIEALKVPHTAESIAYSLSSGGRRFVFSGDTGHDEAFAVWAKGADLLLLECSLPDELAIPMHLTPRQCGAIARIAQPKLLALTHFYPPVEAVDIRAQVAESFTGEVALCVDGWTWDG